MDSKHNQAEPYTYAKAGVSIDAGNALVRAIAPLAKATRRAGADADLGGFGGFFDLKAAGFNDPLLVAANDGVGTKLKLAIESGRHDGVGIDLVAMCVNDLIVQGAEPLFFLDYIATASLVPETVAEIVTGMAAACREVGCALLGGETAEMADTYKPGDFDLAGFTVGVVELKKVIAGAERVEKGDVILGLASSGVHSNGYSLVRAIIKKAKLKLDKVYKELDPDKTLGQVLLEPTRIYVKPIIDVLHKYKVKKPISGMAHITGGGLPGNINRALPDDLDAKLSRKSWDVPPIFTFLQKKGNIADSEMLKVFNMGVGYTLIVRPHFAEAVEKQLKRSGETVFRLGEIVKGSGKVRL